jgi:hypothetical protein
VRRAQRRPAATGVGGTSNGFSPAFAGENPDVPIG